jgi:uncharacterized RDD family membrane protein YckC
VAIAIPFVLAGLVLFDGTVTLTQTVGGQDVDVDRGLVIGGFAGQLAGCLYSILFLARRAGQTIGHKVTRTRVVRLDGRPIGAGLATGRELGAKALLFEGLGGIILLPTLLNYLWPLWDPRGQALHDKVCGTNVVPA